MNDLITVIVPMYNVELYIDKCIKSIQNQTYRNLEIILVNDGSPDNCGLIAEQYKIKDDRITVIHQKNGGLSAARNTGIKMATGKYITFVDSDDYLELDCIEYLYDLVIKNNAEISVCNLLLFFDNMPFVKADKKEKIINYDFLTALEVMLYQKKFETSPCGKIYNIKLFEGIEYPEGKIYEDLGTTYKLFLKAKTITVSNLEKYCYLQRYNGIMRSAFKENDLDYIKSGQEIVDNVSHISNNLKRAAKSRYLSTNFSILMKIPRKNEYESIIKEIKNNIRDVRFGVLIDPKVRFKSKVAILMTYISYDLIYKFYKR